MKSLIKTAKTLGVTTLVVSLSGVLGPISSVLAAPKPKLEESEAKEEKKEPSAAETAMLSVIKTLKNGTMRPVAELRQKLVDAQDDPDAAVAQLNPAIQGAITGLKNLKFGLENVASHIGAQDPALQSFHPLVIGYYSMKGMLHLANHAFGGKVGLSQNTLDELDLVIPAKVGKQLTEIGGQQATANKLESFDLGYTMLSLSNGKVRMSLTPRETNQFRMGAFMAYPSENSAKDVLRFQALKLAFAKQSNYNTFLYNDEKVPMPALPADAEPHYAMIRAHSKALMRESAYRRVVVPNTFKLLSESIAAKRNKGLRQGMIEAFKMFASMFPEAINPKKYAKGGGTPEKVVDKTLELESKRRTDSLIVAMKQSPTYLTEIPRADLKELLYETSLSAFQQVCYMTLNGFMFDLDKIPAEGMGLVSMIFDSLSDAAVKKESVTKEILDRFESYRYEHDLIASFHRYELAGQAIAISDALEAIQKSMTEIERFGTKVPVDYLPKKPEIGVVLAAMKMRDETPLLDGKPTKFIPGYLLEAIQHLGRKAEEAKTDKDRAVFSTLVEQGPEKLHSLAWDISKFADARVRAEILDVHRKLLKYPAYRWSSFDRRLLNLMRQTLSENARKVVADFYAIHEVAEILSTSVIREQAQQAFNIMIDREYDIEEYTAVKKDSLIFNVASLITDKAKNLFGDPLDGVNGLIQTAQEGRNFVKGDLYFIQRMFAPEQERIEYLRSILEDKEVMKRYFQVLVNDFEARFPLLFQSIRLPVKLRKMTGLEDPVTGEAEKVSFMELVTHLKKAIQISGAETSVGKFALKGLKNEVLANTSKLSDPSEAELTPNMLLVNALSGTKKAPAPLWKQFFLNFFDGVNEVFFDSTIDLNVDESQWPKKFLVRDVLPAAFDKDATIEQKTEKMIISAFMKPYLVVGAYAAAREQNDLFDRTKELNRVLLQSDTYRAVLYETGGETAGGMSLLDQKVFRWKHRWLALKEATTKTQEWAHWVFNATFYLPADNDAHAFGGLYMVVSSLGDFVADVGLFFDYWATYSSAKRFYQAGALGNSLVSKKEFDVIQDEFTQHTDMLLDRTPMDLTWYGQVVHGMMMGIRGKMAAAAIKKRMKVTGRTTHDLYKDVDHLSNLNAAIGLQFRPHEAQYIIEFNKKYEAKMKELKAKGKKDPSVAIELKRWNDAREHMEEFFVKYQEDIQIAAHAHMQGPPAAQEAPKSEPPKPVEEKK